MKQDKARSDHRKIQISLQKGYILGRSKPMQEAAVALRREFSFPDEGLKDIVEFYEWEEHHPGFRDKYFNKRIEEVFLTSGKFKLSAGAKFLLPNYVIFNVLNMPAMPLPRVVKELDEYGQPYFVMTYYEHTRKDDVVHAFLEIQRVLQKRGDIHKQPKERMIDPAVLEQAYRAIELSNEYGHRSYAKIAKQMNKEFDNPTYDYASIRQFIDYYKPKLGL